MVRRRRRREQHTPDVVELDPQSPAGRYRAFRERQQYRSSYAYSFAQRLPFALDDFQQQAIDALEQNNNVLVAAPTGAGKTVIADFAVYLARERGVKAFYTTPIKALSNQKYHELVAQYGSEQVGLLTGDLSVNPEAQIVVMTTEVLRNMLYTHSITLHALNFVILDEIHYLADRFRGAVWEEVIIHLPSTVRIVGLSATVSNVEDFSCWIESTRGNTTLVISEQRPVPLRQEVMVQSDERHEPQLYPLFQRGTTTLNHQLTMRLKELDHKAARRIGNAGDSRSRSKRPSGRYHHATAKQLASSRQGRGQGNGQRYTPKRWAVVDELDVLDRLPAIYFIFSRAGCDQAVRQCMQAGLRLTTDSEALRIRHIVETMIDGQLSRDELKALGFSHFIRALEEGIAAHHAGMIALFRQIVETLFEQGLVKIVFATETLALGINMPARSVVIEKLEKFNGTGHVDLTPGEFTQLTGRAGRRGTDTIGHAIVVDHPGFVAQTAASLSSKRVYPLHSSFKPTFSMAVNLLNTSSVAMAQDTLEHSFAQWEANASASSLDSRIEQLEQALHGYEQAMQCEYGDITELLRIRMKLTDAQRGERNALKHRVFSSTKARSGAFRALDSKIDTLKAQDRAHPCRQCPDIDEHMRWGHRWTRETRELERLEHRRDSRTGSVVRRFSVICHILLALGIVIDPKESRHDEPEESYDARRIEQLYEGNMPIAIEHRSLPDTLVLSTQGQLLRRIYSELDIVIAQCLTQGVFDGLSPEAFVAVLSAFVYESRRGSTGQPAHYPGGAKGDIAVAASRMQTIWYRMNTLCTDMDLEPLRPLDFGLVEVVFDWATGADLAQTLSNNRDLTGGDFVRSCKRIIDLLGQIEQVRDFLPDEGQSNIADLAHFARAIVNRSVVAYSGLE